MTHQLPTSRRAFLQSLTASVALAPLALYAEGEQGRKASFLVVSDTHLGRNDQPAAARQWSKTAADLAAAPGDLVLHLGDIVDGGREPQYAEYRRIRDTIRKPVHEIPGNHDPHALFEKHIRTPIDTVVDSDWLRFLLLGNSHVDSHDGFLSESQLKLIDEQCADAASKRRFVIICMHVPVHTNAHPDRGWYVKPADGQTAFYEILARHQQSILALFHGHFHNGVRGWGDHSPVQEIVFPSALYNNDRGLTQQRAAGYNLAEFRPGFTHVAIAGGQMTLRYMLTGTTDSAQHKLSQPQLQ